MVEEREIEFVRAFWARPSNVTYVIFGLNILVFVLMQLAGGSTNDATLMSFGVKSNYDIDHGQIWRLVTPIFLHIGILHIFFNSYAIWVVGPQVEKLYGAARFTIIYILCGVGGVYGSYLMHPESLSAGASGAIFGLFGAMLVFGFKYRSSIPPAFAKAVDRRVLPVIVINLFIGYMIPHIDNSAHVAGLLTGAALAAIIPYQRPGSETPGVFKILQAALVIVVVLSFYEVVMHYDGPGFSFRNLRQIVE